MNKEKIIECLKTNVKKFNRWRKLFKILSVNLECANLKKANLECANLESANLYGANLYFANLKKANLYGANLKDANLESANLKDANLYGANLKEANLDYTCLPLSCKGTRWKIDKKIFDQLCLHICSMDVNDKECKETQEYLMKHAKQSHRYNDVFK